MSVCFGGLYRVLHAYRVGICAGRGAARGWAYVGVGSQEAVGRLSMTALPVHAEDDES